MGTHLKLTRKITLVVLPFLFLTLYGQGSQEKKYYFYRPSIQYGSEVVFSPFTLFINGSYDMFRNGGHNKDVFDKIYYTQGTKNVINNLLNPLEIIGKYGWKDFLYEEIFPTAFNIDEAKSLPNYFTHSMGNGMQYVKAAEWFDYHGVPYPYLFSAVITTFYQFLNEAIENGSSNFQRADPIADMYFFNPLGFLIFSTNFGRKLYSEILPMYDWSLQPIYNPQNQYLENAGQQYIIKRRIPRTNHYSAFLYWGIHGMLGISYNYKEEHNFSFGIGRVANKIKERRKNEIAFLTAELDGTVGFFYDKNHSLMTSVILTGPRTFSTTINIYPGFIRKGFFFPGFYFSFVETDQLLIGLTIAYLPIGIGRGM